MDDLVNRLRTRATIRRQIPTRKSVQEGKPDRIADLLDEAAARIESLLNTGAGTPATTVTQMARDADNAI